MGRNETELTQPSLNEPESPEVAHGEDAIETDDVTPEDINNMTSSEFEKYLDGLGNGTQAEAESENEPAPDDAPEDSSGSEEPENGEPGAPDDTKAAPAYKTFATQEDYERDRDNAISEAFSKRFKNARERDELLSRVERSAKSFYGEDDPVEQMLRDLDEQAADRAGQSVEDFRSARSEQAELEEFRAEKAERERRRIAEEKIISEWKRGEADLKTIVPDFDLNTAMRDKAFSEALSGGASVAQAYMAMQNAAPAPAPKPQRREISQNVQNPRKGTGKSKVNPATLPAPDFMKYIEKQRNG